jgi:membrane-bound lytic murein transglycosylase D
MKHSTRWLGSLFFCLLILLPSTIRAQQDPSAESPFPVVPGLEKAVEFWKRIFTEFSLSQLVFFDALDMSKIYEVIDVGEDSRSDAYINSERARIAAANSVDIERVKAQRGIKERTAAGLKRSGRFIDHMQKIFREAGVPVELTYLPLIESSFDINARSSVGALGMWQFMRTTGKQYLRVGSAIDERRDPLESTRAAATFLGQSYEFLGSWPLAITSYNYGPAGLARAVAELGSSNLVELINKYNHPYWGFAPKNFYAEFLAAVDIGKNVDRYFPGLQLEAPAPIQEVALKSGSSLAAVLNSTNLTQEQFLGWNPAVSAGTRFIPAGYRVKMPVDKTMTPIVEVVQRQPQQTQAQVVHHRVKRGETIFQIAQRYGASVQRILQMNGIRRANLVRVGTTLRIPTAS